MRLCNINLLDIFLRLISTVIRFYTIESAANQENHCLQKKSITIQKKCFPIFEYFFSVFDSEESNKHYVYANSNFVKKNKGNL